MSFFKRETRLVRENDEFRVERKIGLRKVKNFTTWKVKLSKWNSSIYNYFWNNLKDWEVFMVVGFSEFSDYGDTFWILRNWEWVRLSLAQNWSEVVPYFWEFQEEMELYLEAERMKEETDKAIIELLKKQEKSKALWEKLAQMGEWKIAELNSLISDYKK